MVVAGADDSDGPQATAAIESQGGSASFLAADVTDSDSVTRTVSEVVARYAASTYSSTTRARSSASRSSRSPTMSGTAMDFNVKSTFLFCRAVGRHMLDRGGGPYREHDLRPGCPRAVELGGRVRGPRRRASADGGAGPGVGQKQRAGNGIGAGWITPSLRPRSRVRSCWSDTCLRDAGAIPRPGGTPRIPRLGRLRLRDGPDGVHRRRGPRAR